MCFEQIKNWLANSTLSLLNQCVPAFETSSIENKDYKNPGYSFIIELHLLIKGHNPVKEKSGF